MTCSLAFPRVNKPLNPFPPILTSSLTNSLTMKNRSSNQGFSESSFKNGESSRRCLLSVRQGLGKADGRLFFYCFRGRQDLGEVIWLTCGILFKLDGAVRPEAAFSPSSAFSHSPPLTPPRPNTRIDLLILHPIVMLLLSNSLDASFSVVILLAG